MTMPPTRPNPTEMAQSEAVSLSAAPSAPEENIRGSAVATRVGEENRIGLSHSVLSCQMASTKTTPALPKPIRSQRSLTLRFLTLCPLIVSAVTASPLCAHVVDPREEAPL